MKRLTRFSPRASRAAWSTTGESDQSIIAASQTAWAGSDVDQVR
jgi:hypothetical protein